MSGRSVTIVASELLGRPGTGGAGTADSLLAVALGRHGHRVDLVVGSGREIGPINAEWTRIYESASVNLRILDPIRGARPPYLAPTYEVFEALRQHPPDVAIVNDWRGLGFLPLQARETGRALADTAFVVHCHGPGRVLAAFAEKVPDTIERFGEQVIERAAMELADAVVSPSDWLLGWMRSHRWPVPDGARVIQYLRESIVLGDVPTRAANGTPLRRLAFFGQLREGKGIRIFLAALHALEPQLQDGVEVLFLGGENKRWPRARIIEHLPPNLRASARIETELPREGALAELRRPGTLAVMPSLLDNAPNTVSECIEHGIPFVATAVGGIPELVAERDRGRVLCRPTGNDVAAALRHVLTDSDFRPAGPARDPHESLAAWLELVATIQPARKDVGRTATHVAVVAAGEESERRAHRLSASTKTAEVEVVRDLSRRSGLMKAAAEWAVFLDDDDDPDDELLDAFLTAQAASGADVVTVSVRSAVDRDAVQLFLGDPGPLGLVENQYGVIALVRASMAVAELPVEGSVDPDWPLIARLALAGARIVSIPEPLSTHAGRPGRVDDMPGDGLVVLESFENGHSADLPDLPQFAATLAASLAQKSSRHQTVPWAPLGLARRLRKRIGRR